MAARPAARAASELEQQRLGLVILVVRERDRVRTVLARELAQRGIARLARLRLEARARGTRHDDAALGIGDAAIGAGLRAERRPAIGVRLEAVVDVQSQRAPTARAQRRGAGVEQDDRIAAAREREGERAAGRGQGVEPRRDRAHDRRARVVSRRRAP